MMIFKYLVKVCPSQTFCLHWVAWICIDWTLSKVLIYTVLSKMLIYTVHSYYQYCHSSEIRGMCLLKCPSKTLQNFPYQAYKPFISDVWSTVSSNFSDQTFFWFLLHSALSYDCDATWVTCVTFIIENKTSIFTLDPKLWSRQSLASGL